MPHFPFVTKEQKVITQDKTKFEYWQSIKLEELVELKDEQTISYLMEQGCGDIVHGADFTVKWSPPGRAKYRGFEWLTELLYLNRKTVQEDMNAWGMFSSFQYRLSAWWVASLRLDYTQLPHDNALYERGASLAFDFWQSEFVFLRFQYSMIDRNFDESDNRFIFQTCWAMGPHKHEAY